jgi:ABC-type uncharacterized transport system substrate-binding protein
VEVLRWRLPYLEKSGVHQLLFMAYPLRYEVMPMIRKILWLLATLLLVQLAEAQQPKKVPRIGWLAFGTPRLDPQQPFFEGIRSFGWVEGKNIAIERQYANESYTRLGELAAELVRLKVDVIVARDSVAIGPAMRASNTIPIVMMASGDPVADGRIDSLARRHVLLRRMPNR